MEPRTACLADDQGCHRLGRMTTYQPPPWMSEWKSGPSGRLTALNGVGKLRLRSCVILRRDETEGRASVPKYLLQVNYTLEGINGLLAKGGSARKAAAQAAAKSAGGKVESFYFAFGSADAYVIGDFPDNAAAAAVALTVSASGGATVETTVLLTPDEIDKAAETTVKYRPPGS